MIEVNNIAKFEKYETVAVDDAVFDKLIEVLEEEDLTLVRLDNDDISQVTFKIIETPPTKARQVRSLVRNANTRDIQELIKLVKESDIELQETLIPRYVRNAVSAL